MSPCELSAMDISLNSLDGLELLEEQVLELIQQTTVELGKNPVRDTVLTKFINSLTDNLQQIEQLQALALDDQPIDIDEAKDLLNSIQETEQSIKNTLTIDFSNALQTPPKKSSFSTTDDALIGPTDFDRVAANPRSLEPEKIYEIETVNGNRFRVLFSDSLLAELFSLKAS